MAIFRAGTHWAWAAFVGISVLALLGLDTYWLFRESGPVAWLGALEARLLGGRWLPKLTFVLVLLIGVGALLLLKLLIEAVSGRKLTAPVAGERAPRTGG